jgi:HAE1 family hydrophobic/amphiphilic exporter-1
MSVPPEPQLRGNPVADTSIRQPVFITMIMLAALTFGLLAYRTMPVNLLPDIDMPYIAVTVSYPGAGPESVADQVVEPIEEAVNTIAGLDHITSSASEGYAVLVMEFNTGVDVAEADQRVREKVDAVLPRLPSGVRDPIYQRFDPNAQPILSIAVAGTAGQSPQELRRLIEDEIVPQIQRAEGVGAVDVSGGLERQINVELDLGRLQSYGILPAQVSAAIAQANANLGLGSLDTGPSSISLRAPSALQTPADIARVPITGTAYSVGDVASVADGVADAESLSRLDGQDSIILDVRKQSGANTVAVADNVSAALDALFAGRSDLTYSVPVDSSRTVRSSVNSSLEEIFFASAAAFLVVLLFFRNLRSTIITMVGLPVILIGSFIFFPLFGLSINILTLLALSLCVGLVIDDAIVVRENIFRHLERGEAPAVAASKGSAEVGLSVVAMTLTIVAVFVPVTFAQGTAGIIFRSFGLVVAVAILLSLGEAFTLAPMMSANVAGKKPREKHHQAGHGRTINRFAGLQAASARDEGLLHEVNEDPGRLGRAYEGLVSWTLRSLRNRLLVVGVAVGVLVLSVVVASGLKFSFMPEQDHHEFYAGFELPAGADLEETDKLARQAEQVLLADPAVETVVSTVGFQGNPERAQFFVSLVGKTPTVATEDRLREPLAFLPKLAFSTPSFQGSSTGVTGRKLQLSLQTSRPPTELAPAVEAVRAAMAETPGFVDVDTTLQTGKPELSFHADLSRLGDIGFTNKDIATSVRALVDGDTATVLRQNGTDTDVVVRLRAADRAGAAALEAISIPTRAGNMPLSSLGTIEQSQSPATIRRYDRLNQVIVGANLEGVNLGDAQKILDAKLASLGIPADVTTSYVGSAAMQTEGFDSLLLAMALSVLFVYMVLASQFGSFSQPLVIMVAMPFSFVGAFLGLRLAGIDLDITGMIGLIMLLGVVVKNSILLVDFTNRLRRLGMEKHAALELAGAIRLRPILMTALALVAGAIPTALGVHMFSGGDGSEFRRGLAIVLIGGVTTSTLLTLLVIPTIYSLMEGLTDRLGRMFRRRPGGELPQAPAGAASSD